jgi:hypothetical protein
MVYEALNRCPQRTFSEQDQPFQTGFFDAPHRSFGVGVQIGTSGWQFHRFHTGVFERAQKFVLNNGSRSWIR